MRYVVFYQNSLFVLNENLGGRVYGNTLFLHEWKFYGRPNRREKKGRIELRVKDNLKTTKVDM